MKQTHGNLIIIEDDPKTVIKVTLTEHVDYIVLHPDYSVEVVGKETFFQNTPSKAYSERYGTIIAGEFEVSAPYAYLLAAIRQGIEIKDMK